MTEPVDRDDWFSGDLEMPNMPVETPCFVVFEAAVLHNLHRTVEACGDVGRLMPHVKTHRAPWIVRLLRERGIEAFKTATLAEVEMAAECGAGSITWAYPTANPTNIVRFAECARRHPGTAFVGMIDSEEGLRAWKAAVDAGVKNISLRVDLDTGLARTGAPLGEPAINLARELHELGRFAGWHVYDGHVAGDRRSRSEQVAAEVDAVGALQEQLRSEGIAGDVVAGGSYTFNLWPADVAQYVSPGSWTYSSDQHDQELTDLDWRPAAFVLSSVVSRHGGTVTLDAGAKAISPDKPLKERFRWEGEILLMNEEHTIVSAPDGLSVGDRVFLLPRHACTTAYLYGSALVKTIDGRWERRSQLGSAR